MARADWPEIIQQLLGIVGGPANVDAAVQKARNPTTGLPTLLDKHLIVDGASFLLWVVGYLNWTPSETSDSTNVYDMICIFYYIFDQLPLSTYQTAISATSENQPLMPLSAWMVTFAQQMGQYMNTTDSLTAETFASFQAAALYNTAESESPDGTGYHTFNQFFGRHLATPRPISGGGDNKVVVYPADSRFDAAFAIDAGDKTDTGKPIAPLSSSSPPPPTVQVKGLPWDITALLNGSQYAAEFAGGTWAHSFLCTYNYHRMHCPVSGTVVEARVVPGAAYLQVQADPATGTIKKRRLIGPPPTDDGLKIDAVDGSGYQFLQARGLFVIDTSTSLEGDIGLVAILPIGMAQVDSVVPLVRAKGDTSQPTFPFLVQKGDPLAYFQFGGSDIIVAFQAKAGMTGTSFKTEPDQTTAPNDPARQWSRYGQQLAQAAL
ncbi:phosphatidylserine decarboxylase-domain-containing protein [Schizothecium vesticola]|uniref:Phosphatidylserine decarboxylase-domain-containing protein n=1 Tax=Schizothecium vesticola TaxID=314040 RepID=A0AA40F526_9PEZI|nr:phosphatidylserine decarboxylase-domain-containing protein [Schizothecium vesticola]